MTGCDCYGRTIGGAGCPVHDPVGAAEDHGAEPDDDNPAPADLAAALT